MGKSIQLQPLNFYTCLFGRVSRSLVQFIRLIVRIKNRGQCVSVKV